MKRFLVWLDQCVKYSFLLSGLSSLTRRVLPISWNGLVARIRWAMFRLQSSYRGALCSNAVSYTSLWNQWGPVSSFGANRPRGANPDFAPVLTRPIASMSSASTCSLSQVPFRCWNFSSSSAYWNHKNRVLSGFPGFGIYTLTDSPQG